MVVSLGFCRGLYHLYVEDHIISKQWEFYFFFSYLDPFYFFFALIAVANTSKTMLNSSSKSGHPVLFLSLGEMLQFFTIEGDACCGFVIYSFYYIEVCSLYACFLEGFYHKWMLNFVQGFLCIYWDNHRVFIFQFVNVVYYIDWFSDIKESLHSWDKAHLVMVYNFFNMLLESVKLYLHF